MPRQEHLHTITLDAELARLVTEFLGNLNHKLDQILRKEHEMSAELDRLTASTAAIKTVADSAVALINGLAQQIRDNANDPAALNALADELDADQTELADAVAANTPAA